MAGIPTELLNLRQLHQTLNTSSSPEPGGRSPTPTPTPTRAASPSTPRRGPRTIPLEKIPTRGYPVAARGAERFGEWLVRRRCIRRSELFCALDVTYRHGCRLGDALVWLELLDRQAVEREARFFQRLACSTGARVVPPAE